MPGLAHDARTNMAQQENDGTEITDFDVEFIGTDDADITIYISDSAHQISEFFSLLKLSSIVG